MKNKVIQFIDQYNLLSIGDKVLVALSGGPDSVALLHILTEIKNRYNLQIFAAHINHMLRGEEADVDQDFAKDLCMNLGIECFIRKMDVKKYAKENKCTEEEAGRKIRYDFFHLLKKKYDLDKIVLGHHADDNAETVLMRIIRGTGTKGLAGIPIIRKDGIIRPFLCVNRCEIEEYCLNNGLNPRIDESNLKPIYLRNKIRLEVIPYLKKYNANIVSNLNRLSTISSEQMDYFYKEVEKVWEKLVVDYKQVRIELSTFDKLHIAIRKELLRKAIIFLKEDDAGLEFIHIDKIIDMLNKNKSTWQVDLPENIKIIREYDDLYIKKSEIYDKISFYYPLEINKTYFFPKLRIMLKLRKIKVNNNIILEGMKTKKYFDLKKIKGNIILRQRKDGDRFKPLGFNGTKKLKNFYIDMKIPKRNRGKIPLLSIDDDIAWILGYRMSEKFKIDQSTEHILMVEYKYY